MDGWSSQSQWPPEGRDRCRPKHLETVQRYLSNRHRAYQALTVLYLIGMVDNAGIQKKQTPYQEVEVRY
eukprot:1742073-Pyramimonas_sp.AAC.1